MATAARELALRILMDLNAGGITLGDRLAAADAEALPPRDRGFLHELVLGALRHRGLLDHALRPMVQRDLEALDPAVLEALRLGAYQILRMRVPHRAAVSESVELVRTAAPRASGLVNAVLRRLASQGPPSLPDPAADPLGWLTSAGSLPDWLARRWAARLGSATAVARARAFLEVPPAAFRLNPRVTGAFERALETGLEPVPLPVPGAWQARGGRPTDLAAQAVLYLQDQGSQLVARLAARPGCVLDACAAPGGKSTLIGDVLGDAVTVVAGDASPARASSLASLVRRWGSPNVHVAAADALRPPFGTRFDAVLLDAPCTGLGTLGRNPDIRWRASPGDVDRQSRRQAALLAALAPLVKPKGTLVYATCSAEPEENEDPVRGFLETRPGFEPEAAPDWAARFGDGRFLRTLPERDGGDAFFAAVLARR